MKQKEQEEWRANMAEALYPHFKERFMHELVPYVQSQVTGVFNRYLDLPLTVNQVARIMQVHLETVYQWKRRGKLTFSAQKPYTITLEELRNQLAGKSKAEMLGMLENAKSSKVESGDSAGEAISEQ